MSAWELTNITARLVLPPGLLIVLALIGLALTRSSMRLGGMLAGLSLAALYALSMPVVSAFLLRSLEVPYTDPTRDRTADVIVVLGGGSYLRAPEYQTDTVGSATLVRLRYAAYLQRRTGKPILVSGGNPTALGGTSEGEQMRNALSEFGATVRWVEGNSNNTSENARLSQRALQQAGVRSVYLVTHAWHMPRAKAAFERAGLDVIPAGVDYKPPRALSLIDFVPSAQAILDSFYFFHEVLGAVWYRLKFELDHRARLETS